MIIEAIVVGFLSAIGWWGANYYVITPNLPEPIYAKKADDKKPAPRPDQVTIQGENK